MSKNGKKSKEVVMGHAAIGMGKLAVKLGRLALGKDVALESDKKSEQTVDRTVELREVVLPEGKCTENGRDYKSESAWEKSKYKQFSVKIDKEMGEAFARRLSEDKMALVDWFRECVNLYMAAEDSET